VPGAVVDNAVRVVSWPVRVVPPGRTGADEEGRT
jgi:hypothetical protein